MNQNAINEIDSAQQTWHIWKKGLMKMHKEGVLIMAELRNRTYKHMYYYVYEEYQRKKHHRLIKRPIINLDTDDFIRDRCKALDLCKHFRDIRTIETRRTGIKYYQQVRLVNKFTNESYTIAGGLYNENLYGLAWEHYLMHYESLPETYANQHVYNRAYPIQGKLRTFPDYDKVKPGRMHTHYPQILASHLDVTFNYTRQVALNEEYIYFLSGVKRYEEKLINGQKALVN